MFDYGRITELNNSPLKYALVTTPIDDWELTLSKEQILDNLNSKWTGYTDFSNYLDELENFIIKSITIFEEKPFMIKYTSIPNPVDYNFDLVAIAKISNNGTCFIFSNSKEYLKFIERFNKSEKEIKSMEISQKMHDDYNLLNNFNTNIYYESLGDCSIEKTSDNIINTEY